MELKAINAYRLTTNTEDSDVYIHNDEFGCGGDLVECYLKADADKVIAEKDAEISELKENYRNLRRHLFNAGAKWAKQEKMRYTSNGMHKMAGAFENMERMCLEMAENLRKVDKYT